MPRAAWAAGVTERAAPGQTEVPGPRRAGGGPAGTRSSGPASPQRPPAADADAQAAPGSVAEPARARLARSLRPLSRRDVAVVVGACARGPEGGGLPLRVSMATSVRLSSGAVRGRGARAPSRLPPTARLARVRPEQPWASGLARAPRQRGPRREGKAAGWAAMGRQAGVREAGAREERLTGFPAFLRSVVLPLSPTEASRQTWDQSKAGPLAPVLERSELRPNLSARKWSQAPDSTQISFLPPAPPHSTRHPKHGRDRSPSHHARTVLGAADTEGTKNQGPTPRGARQGHAPSSGSPLRPGRQLGETGLPSAELVPGNSRAKCELLEDRFNLQLLFLRTYKPF